MPGPTLLDSSPTAIPLNTRQVTPPPTIQPVLSEGSPSDELIKVSEEMKSARDELYQLLKCVNVLNGIVAYVL